MPSQPPPSQPPQSQPPPSQHPPSSTAEQAAVESTSTDQTQAAGTEPTDTGSAETTPAGTTSAAGLRSAQPPAHRATDRKPRHRAPGDRRDVRRVITGVVAVAVLGLSVFALGASSTAHANSSLGPTLSPLPSVPASPVNPDTVSVGTDRLNGLLVTATGGVLYFNDQDNNGPGLNGPTVTAPPPAGPDPSGTIPPSPNPASPNPASPNPASPNPASPSPASPNPSASTPANAITPSQTDSGPGNQSAIICVRSCARVWHPLLVAAGAVPTAGPGIFGSLDTIERPDGTRQVTYLGHPLYTFAIDSIGHVTGDGTLDSFDGIAFSWHAATANGQPSTPSPSGAPNPSEAPSGVPYPSGGTAPTPTPSATPQNTNPTRPA